MARIMDVTETLWNPWLLGLFLLTGLYVSVRTGFFQLSGLSVWLRASAGSILRPAGGRPSRGISQIQALCTALASTIGTGSIAGVATAIWFGGPGAVFWMWLSAILSMMTGFVEKTLVICFRKRDGRGGWLCGPMYYLRDGLGSRFLALWFALACLCATLVGGNLVQSGSIAVALEAAFGWERAVVGVFTAVAAALVMLGGVGRIARVSTLLVPVMALLYVGGGVMVLCLRAEELPGVLTQIVTSALCPRALFGSGAGYTVRTAMRYGVARGVFTNEAGLGTSAIAHGAAEVDRPGQQGMWGILEVGVSTLLVCTITALVILVSGVYNPARGASGGVSPCGMGASMTTAAFSSALGGAGGAIVAVSLLLFAFSSVLGWSYYGEQCLGYLLGGGKGIGIYRGVFLLVLLVGSLWEGEAVWVLVDLCNAMMAIPNLIGVLLLSETAVTELKNWRRTDGKKIILKKLEKKG